MRGAGIRVARDHDRQARTADLDLAVVGEGPLDWRTLSRLKEAFEESDLPMRVDVLDWHATSESFRKVIEQNYVIFQTEDASGAKDGWLQCTLLMPAVRNQTD